MKFGWNLRRGWLLLLTLYILQIASCAQTPTPKNTEPAKASQPMLSLKVVELTSRNFASHVGDGNIWLIEFYTPWCRHCQEFSNSYANIAGTFHSNPSEGIRVGKVDCTAEMSLRARFGVDSFPTFFVLEGRSVYPFTGRYNVQNLLSFVRGGYKEDHPIPILFSPMGPKAFLHGALTGTGTYLIDTFTGVQESYGVSPLVAGVIMCIFGMMGSIVSVIGMAIITAPRMKQD